MKTRGKGEGIYEVEEGAVDEVDVGSNKFEAEQEAALRMRSPLVCICTLPTYRPASHLPVQALPRALPGRYGRYFLPRSPRGVCELAQGHSSIDVPHLTRPGDAPAAPPLGVLADPGPGVQTPL